MIIEYYTHRPSLSRVRSVKVGQHVIGVRLLEVTITSQEELNELLTETGIKWAKKNLNFAPKHITDVTEGKPDDWLDVLDAIPNIYDCGYNCDCATAIDCKRR